VDQKKLAMALHIIVVIAAALGLVVWSDTVSILQERI
jgi:hypothetical protein